MADEASTRWDRTIRVVKDLGELAKFVALLLAIFGFLLVYFPGLRRSGEIIVQPASWYWIGTVKGGVFATNGNYHSALWQNGVLRGGDLKQLKGSVIVTFGKDLHLGRATPGGRGITQASHAEGVCLYVHDGQVRRLRGAENWELWVKASKVTC